MSGASHSAGVRSKQRDEGDGEEQTEVAIPQQCAHKAAQHLAAWKKGFSIRAKRARAASWPTMGAKERRTLLPTNRQAHHIVISRVMDYRSTV